MMHLGSLILSCFALKPANSKNIRMADLVGSAALGISISMDIVFFDGGGGLSVPDFSFLLFCLASIMVETPILSKHARLRLKKLPATQFFGSVGVLLVYWILRAFEFECNGHLLLAAHFISLIRAVWTEKEHTHEEHPDAEMDVMLRSMRSMRIVELGPSMGLVLDHEIPQWIKLSNGRVLSYRNFIGNAPVDQFDADGVVIAPGLFYSDQANEQC